MTALPGEVVVTRSAGNMGKALVRGMSLRTRVFTLILALTLTQPAFRAFSADTWLVEKAPIRFTLRLGGRPTHGSCGYFVHLPDGGILPTPYPRTHVLTSSGKSVESYTLWHNRMGGLAMVFEDPGSAGEVHVYVEPASRLRLWHADSGLTPSAILCADPTSGSLATAKKLAAFGRVGDTVHAVNRAGAPRAPLCIEADHSGRPRPCAFYLLAYLVTSDPGKTWIAPFIQDGQCEMKIDGTTLTPRKRIDKWGGTGQWVEMSKGLHRLDVYQSVVGTGGFSGGGGGIMYLTWRTPKTTMEELGGVRSDKVPMSGTSRMETRVVRDNEIARSGSCTIGSAERRDGGPVARIGLRATHNYWFEGEDPTLIYDLSALSGGNPANTKYRWSFEGKGEASGKKLSWMFPGQRENRVRLRATADGRASECIYPFYGFSTVRTSLNRAMDRRSYRKASLDMFEAFPADSDPSAAFGPAYWNSLFRTLELGKGYALFLHFFSVRPKMVRGRLSPMRQALMEDLFLDFAPRVDKREAIQWTRRFQRENRDATRKRELKITEAEIHMYYTGNTNAARTILKTLAQGSGETAERARIRLGDLAFLAADLNTAIRYYSDVQNRVRLRKTIMKDRAAAAIASAPAVPDGPTRMGRTLDDAAARRGWSVTSSRGSALPSADWKLGALLDVARAEHIRALIEQDELLNAWDRLREWELYFPMSKVSGDYLIHESSLYMKMKNWRRARPMIEAYCRVVDASSFMAEAAESTLTCMTQMRESGPALKEFAKEMSKRLENHPAGRKFKAIAERY